MIARLVRSALSLTVAALLLSSCGGLTAGTQPTLPSATEAASATNSGQTTATVGESITLTVWLPPQFDPAGGSIAAGMLQARLGEFSNQHPQVQVIVRVKAESGPGGLLDSLLAAQQAAPLALPDLALLPSTLIASAVESEVLQPTTSLGSELASDDWYAFAKQMASLNKRTYGLPFAADGLVLAYRSTAVAQAPATWQQLLAARKPLGFAAADPQAQFASAQLLSLQSEDASEFTISDETLLTFFQFLADAQAKEIFPFWLSQYQNHEQTWQAFTEGRLPMTAAWTSQIFANQLGEIKGAPLPTKAGETFTLAKGWVWAITATDEQVAALAADLAQFLTAPEFMAQYTAAAGLLPARASSLAAWSPNANQALASQILSTAIALPDETKLNKWGAALFPAVIAVLKQESTPAQAVQSVRDSLANAQ